MEKTIKLTENKGGKEISRFVVFEYDKNIPFDQAILETVLECCSTDEGVKKNWTANGINFGEFLTKVPDSVCKKHGLRIWYPEQEAIPIEDCTLMWSSWQIKIMLHQNELAKARWDKLAEVLPDFIIWTHEMLGSNPALSVTEQKELSANILSWALDYMDDDSSDRECLKRKFWQNKLAEMEKSKA